MAPYVYHETHGNIAITAGVKHSGTKSVRTRADPMPQSPYTIKRGGGATQIIQTNIKDLDMILSFWVLPAVSGRNDHANIITIIHMKLEDSRSINLSYMSHGHLLLWASFYTILPTTQFSF
ncbi:hypothetical protein [[Eubacterium] cellulosolvens]